MKDTAASCSVWAWFALTRVQTSSQIVMVAFLSKALEVLAAQPRTVILADSHLALVGNLPNLMMT